MIAPPTRSDGEVLELILAVARADPRVRAVVLSGSRADTAAPADPWRDFDVVYVVRDVAPFRAEPAWIDVFGERTILQRPDAMVGAAPRDDGGEAYLMLFVDGHRIDLTLLPVAAMDGFRHEGPADVLLDLDGVVPAPPAPGAPHHVPEPPTEAAFDDVCNEFWWVAPYVAKGLARGQLTYARRHLDTVLRAQLLTMLGWEVAAASGFRRGPGKAGRDLRRLLPSETWARLEATYADADPAHGWAALEAMTGLFRDVASGVAARFALTYPERDDERVTAHLVRMRTEAVAAGLGAPPAPSARCGDAFAGVARTASYALRTRSFAPVESSERSHPMKITIETTVAAPIDEVWRAWTTPDDIVRWNAASDDWHTTDAHVDLRVGGTFTSRMEAKDGSAGFDFSGTYTNVVPHELIEYVLEDGRVVSVEFREHDGAVRVRETFDAESTHTAEQQRDGWQAILDNFARHVEASR